MQEQLKGKNACDNVGQCASVLYVRVSVHKNMCIMISQHDCMFMHLLYTCELKIV